MSSECGCKEVYRFPHITYRYILILYLLIFAAASLLFVHFKNVFRSVYIIITGIYPKIILIKM